MGNTNDSFIGKLHEALAEYRLAAASEKATRFDDMDHTEAARYSVATDFLIQVYEHAASKAAPGQQEKAGIDAVHEVVEFSRQWKNNQEGFLGATKLKLPRPARQCFDAAFSNPENVLSTLDYGSNRREYNRGISRRNVLRGALLGGAAVATGATADSLLPYHRQDKDNAPEIVGKMGAQIQDILREKKALLEKPSSWNAEHERETRARWEELSKREMEIIKSSPATEISHFAMVERCAIAPVAAATAATAIYHMIKDPHTDFTTVPSIIETVSTLIDSELREHGRGGLR